MPPLVPVAGAAVERVGASDWIETQAGRRRLRTFDGVRGTWRLSALGRSYFASRQPPSEFVLKLPAKFYTTRADGTISEYRGWYPVANLGLPLRQTIQNALRAAGGVASAPSTACGGPGD